MVAYSWTRFRPLTRASIKSLITAAPSVATPTTAVPTTASGGEGLDWRGWSDRYGHLSSEARSVKQLDEMLSSTTLLLPELDSLLAKWTLGHEMVHLANYGTGQGELSMFPALQWCERQVLLGNHNFVIASFTDPPGEFETDESLQGACLGHLLASAEPLELWRQFPFCQPSFAGGPCSHSSQSVGLGCASCAFSALIVSEILKRGISVLVSNVDVIWFRNFDPKQLSQDVAFQVYSGWSSQQFQQSLADGKVCGSTATGARCTSFAMPNSTTSPTARRFQARAQCLEAIFNFGFYFVKASAAAINLQAELAKAVLTRSTEDQPSFGSTPGFLGRPVCHDNNEFNLLATSQQQRLFKRLFVDDVQVDVHCEDNFEPLAPSERYPLANQYTQYKHIVAAESADIRIWNPQQAPVSIQYILENVDLREVVGVHLTLQNTKAPLML